MRKGYVEFLQGVAEKHSVDRIVFMGDVVDWASISYHEKPPGLKDSNAEYKKALKQVAQLRKAFPKADWLIGNHDALGERQMNTAGLPTSLMKDYNTIWEVDWKVHPRFTKLIIDGVIHTHGDGGRGGQQAAYKQAKDNFRSTVTGHFHSEFGVWWWANPEFRIFGMNVGWGGDVDKLQFEYGMKFTKKPILGCGVVINGKLPYAEPWLLRSR